MSRQKLEGPRRGLASYLPPVRWLSGYGGRDLIRDSTAGVLVAILLVPQAMAYAMLAELPPRTGLYAAMLPALLYAVLGTSRYLSVGPVALVSLLVADATARASKAGVELDSLATALTLATLVGLTLIVLGIFQLGFVANFLSNPVLIGFTAGAAILIGASQLGPLLGLEIERGQSLFGTLAEAARELQGFEPATAALGSICLAALVLAGEPLRRLLAWTPLGERARSAVRNAVPLLVTAGAIFAVRSLGLRGEGGVATVGELGGGLPPISLPSLAPELWRQLASSALSLALVAFVIAVAIAKSLASRRGQRIDPSQEMIALGAANVAAGVTGACPVGGSVSRSALAFSAGAVTPLTQVATVAMVVTATLTLGPLLADLPRTTLAAIILSAVVGMVDVAAMRRVFRISRYEAITMAATFAAVVGLGVQAGIAVGAVSALGLYLFRTSLPRIVIEGYHEEAGRFANREQDGVRRMPEHVLVLRVDESLYFANSRHCEDQIIETLEKYETVRRLVLDFSAVGEIDSTALEMLEQLSGDLEQAGIEVVFSHLREPVLERFERASLIDALGDDRFFETTEEAVGTDVEDGDSG